MESGWKSYATCIKEGLHFQRGLCRSIEALRACFEPNVDPQNTPRAIKNSPASIKSADITHVNDGEAEQRQNLKESPKSQTDKPSSETGKR